MFRTNVIFYCIYCFPIASYFLYNNIISFYASLYPFYTNISQRNKILFLFPPKNYIRIRFDSHKTLVHIRTSNKAEPSHIKRTIPQRMPFKAASKVSLALSQLLSIFWPKRLPRVDLIRSPNRSVNLACSTYITCTQFHGNTTLWCVFRTRTLTRPRGSLVCVFDLDIVR